MFKSNSKKFILGILFHSLIFDICSMTKNITLKICNFFHQLFNISTYDSLVSLNLSPFLTTKQLSKI
jgi:hypothetical protein